MPDLFYRAASLRAFLGIRLDDLAAVMGPSAYAAAVPALSPYVTSEPLHVGLRDLGYRDGDQTPFTVILDLRGFETSFGMNEVPRALARVAHGRDATALTRGVANAATVAPAHVLERYLNAHVRARIFFRAQTTAGAGVFDVGDNDLWPDEWVVAFDGYCIAPTRRGTPEDHTLVVHLTHLLAGLTYSSSISGSVAAGTGSPAAFDMSAFGAIGTGAGVPMTAAGAVASGLAGGIPLQTDFWGYRRTDGEVGLKGFLNRLAATNTFAAHNFLTTLDGAACSQGVNPLRGQNVLALTALDAIEPFGRATSMGFQTQVTAAIQAANGVPLDRGSLIDRIGETYQNIGYRYGMPIPFRLDGAVLTANASLAFAGDIFGATVNNLGPASFWELMAVQYPSRYQISVCPSAAGGVVAPFAPVLAGWWQTIHASEIHDWGDDMANPVPVRGVVLVSNRAGIAGAFTAGVTSQATPGAVLADGGYDSCLPGVIIHRDMPPWLVTDHRFPGSPAPMTIGGPRTTAALSAVTGTAAVAASPSAGPIPAGSRKTANRLAKSLYQQARLLPRTVSVTSRFRTDIAPGSTVRVELPSDRFVRAGLGSNRDAYLVGLATRVVMTVDVDAEAATTQLQLGFVRTEGETRAAADNSLYGASHPFWNSIWYGHPLCDSVAARTQLGNRSVIGD